MPFILQDTALHWDYAKKVAHLEDIPSASMRPSLASE